MPTNRRTSFISLFLLLVIVLLVSLAPRERSLGANVRLVYLHGAWVWTAIAGYLAAGLLGVVGLLTRQVRLQRWSIGAGLSATIFWITYLPLSLWTMQANWNGIFLEEPRWRMALDLALAAMMLQAAGRIMGHPPIRAAVNVGFPIMLGWALVTTDQVMHPPSPIFTSNSQAIQAFFVTLVITCLLLGWQLARLLVPQPVRE